MFDLKRIDLLVAAALREAQGDPAIEAIARARAGLGAVSPPLRVEVIRVLAILGEYVTVDAVYDASRDGSDGAVHFEAGLAALMMPDPAVAEARMQRAVDGGHAPAWNALAILRALRRDLPGARAAICAGLEALPGDAAMRRTASVLSGDSLAELHGLLRRFPEHAALARAAAAKVDLLRVKGLLLRRAGELEGR